MNYTSQQFTHTTDSARINRKASFWTFTAAMCLFGSTALPSHPVTKIFTMAIAGVLSRVSLRLDAHQEKTLEPYAEIAHNVSKKAWTMQLPKGQLEMQTVELLDKPTYYNWDNIADEAVGFLICGNSGSAKSSLATWLAGHLSKTNPTGVIALDPHYNECWKLAGITSIGKIEQIEAALKWLLAELDARCDRKGEGKPLGDPLFVICDELNAALERFKDKKVVESALKRLGSEGRKFGLTFCGLNQSSNVNAIGIDSKYRSNYALILLGQSARSHPQLGKHFVDVAYPCLLDGSIAPSPAIHPTHGSYQTFKKVGNPPKNLRQINQLALPQSLLNIIDDSLITNTVDNKNNGCFHNLTAKDWKDLSESKTTITYPHLQKIIDYLDGRDWTRDNLIKQSIADFKNRNEPLETIQGYLQLLEVQGHIETRNAGRNGLEAKKL